MYIDFLENLHKCTKRDYLERVTQHDKIECTTIAKQYGREYFDGDRRFGYGGYYYDGRWEQVARNMIQHYKLDSNCRILDVGCAKGYLLFEFKKLLPNASISGVDISEYAIHHAKPEIKKYVRRATAQNLPFEDESFDMVVSLNTLHNLYLFDLQEAVSELSRVLVKNGNSYIVVESYRNDAEKVNLLYWQLTCELLFTPEEWEWIFPQFGYRGDYSFIFFE